MIALSIDNLLFILLIAAAALFQLLSKALKRSKDQTEEIDETLTASTPKIPPQIRRLPVESDADRIRKFLEALGQPPTSTPPPPVAPRSNIPPHPLAPVQPPPVIPGAWRLPRDQQTRRDISQRESSPAAQRRHTEFVPPTTPAALLEIYERPLPAALQQPSIVSKTPAEPYATPKAFVVAKDTDFKARIATVLASKSGLREVIILREIFGPPRGLQAVDLP